MKVNLNPNELLIIQKALWRMEKDFLQDAHNAFGAKYMYLQEKAEEINVLSSKIIGEEYGNCLYQYAYSYLDEENEYIALRVKTKEVTVRAMELLEEFDFITEGTGYSIKKVMKEMLEKEKFENGAYILINKKNEFTIVEELTMHGVYADIPIINVDFFINFALNQKKELEILEKEMEQY